MRVNTKLPNKSNNKTNVALMVASVVLMDLCCGSQNTSQLKWANEVLKSTSYSAKLI